MSVHLGLSISLKAPEVLLSQDEAHRLAVAAKAVQDLYPIPIVDPRVVAWANLGIAFCVVYGPRAYNIRARMAEERRAQGARNIAPAALGPSPLNGSAKAGMNAAGVDTEALNAAIHQAGLEADGRPH